MNLINQEFESFMKRAFPRVQRDSDQWVVLELVWNSAICLSMSMISSPKISDQQGSKLMAQLHEESHLYCKNYITRGPRHELN